MCIRDSPGRSPSEPIGRLDLGGEFAEYRTAGACFRIVISDHYLWAEPKRYVDFFQPWQRELNDLVAAYRAAQSPYH